MDKYLFIGIVITIVEDNFFQLISCCISGGVVDRFVWNLDLSIAVWNVKVKSETALPILSADFNVGILFLDDSSRVFENLFKLVQFERGRGEREDKIGV